MSIPRRTAPSHPALVQHAEDRAQNIQNRIADTITRFAGSMMFVYVHVIWFGAWIIFAVEHYPFGLLTMIVSLEAIFPSASNQILELTRAIHAVTAARQPRS